MSEKLEEAVKETVKKIVNDKESLNILRANEFLRDEIRFLSRQIERLETQVTRNKMRLAEKYPASHKWGFFWFWHPIEMAFLTNRKPERKKLLKYFERMQKKVRK